MISLFKLKDFSLSGSERSHDTPTTVLENGLRVKVVRSNEDNEKRSKIFCINRRFNSIFT